MTIGDAYDRAVTIWGRDRIISVQSTHFIAPNGIGGAYVNLREAGIASDVRERNYAAHQLDGNGHAICHQDCARLEEANAR